MQRDNPKLSSSLKKKVRYLRAKNSFWFTGIVFPDLLYSFVVGSDTAVNFDLETHPIIV